MQAELSQRQVHLASAVADALGDGASHLWQVLAKQVSQFAPDILVMVARKAPRLQELLRIPAATERLRTTDMALPFIGRHLLGARVAIVDDLVNYGSTVQHALDAVRQARPSATQAFALARGPGTPCLSDSDITYASPAPLPKARMDRLAYGVPSALAFQSRPFDLAFPVFPCALRLPLSQFSDVMELLESCWSPRLVHHHSTAPAAELGLHRVTLDAPKGGLPLRKVRCYVDMSSRTCNLVPISIPAVLPRRLPDSSALHSSLRTVFERAQQSYTAALHGSPRLEGLAFARLQLFITGLEMGAEVLPRLSRLLTPSYADVVDPEGISLVFGPDLVEPILAYADVLLRGSYDPSALLSYHLPPSQAPTLLSSNGRLEETLRATIASSECTDLRRAVQTAFAVLADFVGAPSPDAYLLQWPFSSEEVTADPYLRLRAGYSLNELLDLVASPALAEERESRLLEISSILDESIDAGWIVPTMMPVPDGFARVYRNGESKPHDDVAIRAARAWKRSGLAISPTEFSKLWAVLTFSKYVDTGATLAQEERGTVAAVPSYGGSPGQAIGTYLRGAGYLRQ